MEDFIIFSGNNHVIHIDTKPSLCNLLLEYVIHHGLEGGGGVGQTKEHDSWFEESFASFEGGFIFIAFFNANVVVSCYNPPQFFSSSLDPLLVTMTKPPLMAK